MGEGSSRFDNMDKLVSDGVYAIFVARCKAVFWGLPEEGPAMSWNHMTGVLWGMVK